MGGKPHICHIYHIWYMWRKNCHVEKFQIFMHDRCVEIWNFSACEEFKKNSPHRQCGEVPNFSTSDLCDVENVFTNVQFMLYCCKICFVAICAVLLQNQYCRNLRTFVWRNFLIKNCACGKIWQICGMFPHIRFYYAGVKFWWVEVAICQNDNDNVMHILFWWTSKSST